MCLLSIITVFVCGLTMRFLLRAFRNCCGWGEGLVGLRVKCMGPVWDLDEVGVSRISFEIS